MTEKIDDFEMFYKKLFSHEDRPNNCEQQQIEENVREYYDQIKNVVCDDVFTSIDLEHEIGKLVSGKAPGSDNVFNEMFIFGKESSVFIRILVIFFNAIIVKGYFPKNFNISLITLTCHL